MGTKIKYQSKIMRFLQLSETIKNKHDGRKISNRALHAHQPIYDAHYFRAMDDTELEDQEN